MVVRDASADGPYVRYLTATRMGFRILSPSHSLITIEWARDRSKLADNGVPKLHRWQLLLQISVVGIGFQPEADECKIQLCIPGAADLSKTIEIAGSRTDGGILVKVVHRKALKYVWRLFTRSHRPPSQASSTSSKSSSFRMTTHTPT